MQVKKQQLELDMEQQTGSKLGKEYIKAVCCHPAYLILYADYLMRNARLDEAQAGIKIAGRNMNNLRYTGYTTLSIKWRGPEVSLHETDREESEKSGLKLIQKTKLTASGPINSWQRDG